jgi:hypothetical protein
MGGDTMGALVGIRAAGLGEMMDAEIALALAAVDDAYVETEQSLFAIADADVLETDRDPALITFGAVLHGARAGLAETFAGVFPFLDNIEDTLRGMPISAPTPSMVAGMLEHRYQGNVSAFLAWRLVKQPSLPLWRAMTILLYCEHQHDPAALPALVRFLSTTTNDELFALARRCVRAYDGVFDALVAELRWRKG